MYNETKVQIQTNTRYKYNYKTNTKYKYKYKTNTKYKGIDSLSDQTAALLKKNLTVQRNGVQFLTIWEHIRHGRII